MKFSSYISLFLLSLPFFANSQFETQFDDGSIKVKRKTTDFSREEIVNLASRETISFTLEEVNEAGIKIDEMNKYSLYLYSQTRGDKIYQTSIDGVYQDTLEQGAYYIYLQKKPNPNPVIDTIAQLDYDINTFGEAYLCQLIVKEFAHNEFKIKILHTKLNHLFDPIEVQLLKPVIYLYSDEPLSVDLDLKVNGELTFSYPDYNNGWHVDLDSNGIQHEGKSYPYLFWEGDKPMQTIGIEGFCVEGKSIVSFLENVLTSMNFNAKEKTDFITFWAPRMQTNTFNNIRFLFGEDYENLARLKTTPQPDNQLRVFMVYEASEEGSDLIEQELPQLSRSGFTLIEWGGGELKNNNLPNL